MNVLNFFKEHGTIPSSRHILEHNIEIPLDDIRVKETNIYGAPARRNESLPVGTMRWIKK